MSGDRVPRRLRRILTLVPYAIHHPGVSLDELARKFAVPRRELQRDLELLFLCGLPGYGPGDLIDVDLDGDRVYVRMADYFKEPLRLSPAEALSLYSSSIALTELPGMEAADALRRAAAKLGRALGIGGASEGGTVDVAVGDGGRDHLQTLQQAIHDHRAVEMEYFSASRGEMTARVVEPWALLAALGNWYLIAFDRLSSEERMFRADRIKTARVTQETYDVPSDLDLAEYRRAFRSAPHQATMTIEISPEVARWFGDYYPLEMDEALADGWHRVELRVSALRWAALLVIRLGSGVRAVSPPEVLDEARTVAHAIAARHAEVTRS